MDILTPKPPFDPKRKNNAVDFGKPKFVNAMKAKQLSKTGDDTTIYSLN